MPALPLRRHVGKPVLKGPCSSWRQFLSSAGTAYWVHGRMYAAKTVQESFGRSAQGLGWNFQPVGTTAIPDLH